LKAIFLRKRKTHLETVDWLKLREKRMTDLQKIQAWAEIVTWLAQAGPDPTVQPGWPVYLAAIIGLTSAHC